MRHKKQHKKQRSNGFSLIELLVAISIFAIIMTALSGLIVQGLRLRRVNELESQAQAYAATVLERYKAYFSVNNNYDRYVNGLTDREALNDIFGETSREGNLELPAAFEDEANLTVTTWCIDVEGDVIADTACAAEAPPLRRIRVTLSNQDTVYADLFTEVGDPSP